MVASLRTVCQTGNHFIISVALTGAPVNLQMHFTKLA